MGNNGNFLHSPLSHSPSHIYFQPTPISKKTGPLNPKQSIFSSTMHSSTISLMSVKESSQLASDIWSNNTSSTPSSPRATFNAHHTAIALPEGPTSRHCATHHPQITYLTTRAYAEYRKISKVLIDLTSTDGSLSSSESGSQRMANPRAQQKYEAYLRISIRNRDERLFQLSQIRYENRNLKCPCSTVPMLPYTCPSCEAAYFCEQDISTSVSWIHRHINILQQLVSFYN